MPSGFNFGGTRQRPPAAPEEQMGPPEAPVDLTTPLQNAFLELANSGAQNPGPEPTHTWRPFVGMIPNQRLGIARQQALAPVQKASMGLLDEFLSLGVPADRAQGLALMQTSRRLRELGFVDEAAKLQAQGIAALKTAEEFEMTKQKHVVDVANTQSTRVKRDEELEASTETWVKIDGDTGKILDAKQLFVTDDDILREHARAGYIKISSGNSMLNLTTEDFASGRPPPETILENIVAADRMLSNLDVLWAVKDQTGILEGPLRGAMAARGISLFGNGNFVDALAVTRQMKADIQSLVKGIPSNYDAAIFELTVPDPTRFAGSPIYQAQLRLLDRNVRSLVALTLAYYQGTNRALPPAVEAWARSWGISVNDVAPMSPEDVARVNRDKDVPFDQQNNPFADHARNSRIQTRRLLGPIQDELPAPEGAFSENQQRLLNDLMNMEITTTGTGNP